ncbi:CYFA0S01e05732g1_1 [Cyberlindnera fabianii]|uniref:CYFA0S01e05732g1_1 n=1 Tax=Cyberlindnera fabianii TaxID=36022 RepID=A0A061AHC1_CYBFA|nr:CYFA0S01e05732g1_1 [Cyberlindnera fabianii]
MHSDEESINSYDLHNNPQAYVPDNQDAQSELSAQLSRTTTSNNVRLVPTETAKSLQEMGVQSEPPIPDVNAPQNVKNAIFPEEYTLETPTGLVPVATLQEMGRSQSRTAQLTRTRTNRDSSIGDDTNRYNGDDDSSATANNEKNTEPELDPEIEFVTFITNDPDNPHNWPTWLRWVYTINLSILVIAVAFGSSCVTGGLGLINDKYHVSTEVSTLTCSLMVLGFSVGPLLWSPLSEQIGRQPVYFISLFLYVIFNIPCAVAKNIGTLLVCRFLCGVWASSGLSLVGGSIADMFPTETRGEAIAYFAFAPYCGPVFGPLICGWINIKTERLDLIFWVNLAFAGLMWITSTLVPETYAPVILKKRAKRLRKETGNPKIMTEQEAQGMSLKELVMSCLIRPLYFAVTEPVLDLMCFYVCLIYALLYAFFFAYPVIFEELYGYNDAYIGLMLIPILIGACLALVTTPICEKKYVAMTKRRKPTPEDRLVGAMIGAPFAAIALWILGATSYKHIIWVGPASSGLAFGYGMVLIYYSINNYIIDCYAVYASSALATKVFLRSAGGAAFPLFTPQMYRKLGLNWASWLLAFISTAMVLIPFGFYFYGKTLRSKLSKKNYSTLDEE